MGQEEIVDAKLLHGTQNYPELTLNGVTIEKRV